MTPTPAADEPEYLKVEEVAARLKLKEKTIRDWILRGELPAYKLGKEWRIRRDHFDEAMEARLVTGEPAPDRWTLGSRYFQIGSSGSLQPLRCVCILHGSPPTIGGMVRMAVIDATYEPELLRPTEVLRILKVSKTWLYDAAKDGRIACVRLGGPDGPLRFERAVIEALIRDSRLGDHNRE